MRTHVTDPKRSRKPGLFLRWLFRLPVYLYRLRVGWVFGRHLLMLVHRGRRTGHLHRTVLEVVRFDPGTGESIVAVAYGLSADWYRNILAGPALAIYTGRDSYTPAQRFLTVDQVEAELADYERRYPRLLRVLLRMIGIEYDGTARGRRALAAHLPMVAFRPPEPGQAR